MGGFRSGFRYRYFFRRKGEKIMKVNEFIEKYEKNNRIDIAKELDVQSYIGIAQKAQLAESVIENCISVVDGKVCIDSVKRYMLFTIIVIDAHTNLEFDYEDGNIINEYDQLCSAKLLTKIIDTFSDDYAACQEVLKMITVDKTQESMTLEQIVYSFLDSTKSLLKNALNGLVDQIDLDALQKLPINPENLSIIREFINNK